jgi:protein involved in polysaccharide export with SLBB domain
MKWITLLGVALMALGLVGCISDKPAPITNPCVLDELRVGDIVTITYTDVPQGALPTEQKLKLKEDGTLTLPMNISVLAATKKAGVVEKEIRALYVPRLFNQLTVTIKTEDRFYSVGGEVKNPGRQLYLGPTTVLRAIQSCGDFSDFANKGAVEIHRADGTLQIVDCKRARKDPKWDLPICPGDSINVPRRKF